VLTPLPLPGGTTLAAVESLMVALGRLLDGVEPRAIFPHPPEATPEPDTAPAAGPGVVIATSGSTTGSGQLVDLSPQALVASAHATYERLAGPGQWVACLPVHHIAGLQVLVRSHVGGTRPVVVDTTTGFDAERLASAVNELSPRTPGYLSVVPTQLARLLAAGPAVFAPLRGLAAILVGGAATAPRLLADAREAGLPVVTTYGMTETGGGCVYDGRPLDDVAARVDEEGRVWLGGPTLARGYLGDPAATAASFVTHRGRTWLRTNDRGRWDGDRLVVLGRLDDVIISGGSNVPAGEVARVIAELGVADVVVVGVSDAEWGQLVTAVIAGPAPPLAEIRAHVRAELGAHCAPRALVRVERLPLRGLGKPDRQAAAALASRALESDAALEPARSGVLGVERRGH